MTDKEDELEPEALEAPALKTLLDAYRDAARGSDDKIKIALLRQIVLCDRDRKWHDTLRVLEERRLEQLIREAKMAIQENRLDDLRLLQRELTNPQWSIPVPDAVKNKIDTLLENDRMLQLQKEADASVEAINLAYSAFEYEALTVALATWDHLIEQSGYNADIATQMHVKEAREWYTQQQSRKEEQRQFDENLFALRKLLEKEAPAEEIAALFRRLQHAEQQIPPSLQAQVAEYLETRRQIALRRRTLRLSVVTVSLLAVIALVAVAGYLWWGAWMERKWGQRLTTALFEEPSAIGLQLLDDLKSIAPSIRKRPNILELDKKLQRKAEEEQEKRRQFDALVTQIRRDLADFNANQDRILTAKVQLLQYIVDQRERGIYDTVEREYVEGLKHFSLAQEKQYITLANTVKAARRQFFTALEAQDFAAAEQALNTAAVAREAAGMLKEIAVTVKQEQRKYFDGVQELGPLLSTEKNQSERRNELLAMLRAPESLEMLQRTLEEYLQISSGRPESAALLDFLQQQLRPAQAIAEWTPERTSSNTMLQIDMEELKRLRNARVRAGQQALTEFSAMVKSYEQTPVCAMLFRSTDQKTIYEFYRTTDSQVLLAGDAKRGEYIFYPCNLNGNTESWQVEISLANGVAALKTPQEIYQANLMFPAEFNVSTLAPHIQLVKQVVASMSEPSEESEEKLVMAYTQCVTNCSLSPYLAMRLAQRIIGILAANFPETPDYKTIAGKLENLSGSVSANYDWVSAWHSSPEQQNVLRQGLAELAGMLPEPGSSRRIRLLETALSRKIIPAGYLLPGTEQEASVLVLLPGVPRSGECWLRQVEPERWVEAGHYSGTVLTSHDAVSPLRFQPWQVIYTPTDGRDSTQLAGDLQITPDAWLPLSWPRPPSDAQADSDKGQETPAVLPER